MCDMELSNAQNDRQSDKAKDERQNAEGKMVGDAEQILEYAPCQLMGKEGGAWARARRVHE